MPDTVTRFITCPLCEAECGLEIITCDKEIQSIRGDRQNTYSNGFICPKALALKDLYNDPDRLKYPVKRTGNEWRQISWNQAFDEIEQQIKKIRGHHGDNALATFMGNPNVHYHGNMLYIGMLIKTLKTKNRYSSSSLDQLPLMMCCYLMFGHQLMFPVPDIDRTDFFLIIGANPAVSGGSIMTASGASRRIKGIQKRQGKVVVVDPVLTRTASLADQHLFIRPGTDVYFLAALVNTVFEEGLDRPGRLGDFSDGIEAFKTAVQNFTPEKAAGMTGISAEDIRQLARDFCRADKAVCYGRMGTSVQAYGTLSTWLILAFNIITGKMDQPGGFMFPTPALDLVDFTARANEKGYVGRHHSRVSKLPDFAGEFPASVLAEEILTEGDGRVRALLTVAGNPVLGAPNGRMMDRALAHLDFMVAIDWYIHESSRHAHIILPPTCILEHHNFMTMINLAGARNYAAYSQPVFQPQPGTRHNWEILSELSARFVSNPFLRFALKLAKPERLLGLMLRFGPHGSGLNFLGSGLTLSKVKRAVHGIDLGPLVPRLPDRLFTKNKRIDLAPKRLTDELKTIEDHLEQVSVKTSADGPDLLLISRRNLMSNNSWFHNYPAMKNRTNRCTLMINTKDAENRSIKSGDTVRVTSNIDSINIEAEVTDRVMPGVVSMPHGWGHDRPGVALRVAAKNPGVSINDITDNKRIDLSGTAAFSGLPVRVEK
ncbi:molybdopterin-dependent oxidoreductase [Desulfosudis oleivorans]|uniref:Molydopterin dinucleotide-binding region n=1 Tax=Desulfosudis oleivorans (strain DSM 6200 / JCM 39069 / Hxd3) TaxID=96561 RepID=A8ZZE8_DESOH|nr:molybdopterin-dependent oxidoreductase [Desulfosudis oleivorans]ABW67301.1 molydopterin dinucleotide-binding region [Desulfosudis oleivorans Hxd3]